MKRAGTRNICLFLLGLTVSTLSRRLCIHVTGIITSSNATVTDRDTSPTPYNIRTTRYNSKIIAGSRRGVDARVRECHVLSVNFTGQQQNKNFDVTEINLWLEFADVIFGGTSDSRKYVCVRGLGRDQHAMSHEWWKTPTTKFPQNQSKHGETTTFVTQSSGKWFPKTGWQTMSHKWWETLTSKFPQNQSHKRMRDTIVTQSLGKWLTSAKSVT